MTDAYNSVMEKEMSSSQAAKYYGVNKKSLLVRVRGEIPVNAHVGNQTALPAVCEEELSECLKLLADWGWGFSKEEVKDIVNDFVTKSGIETPFIEGRPGREWLENFLKRHNDIVPRKTEHLRVKGLPQQIFNVDESGFVTDPKSQVVLARKGSKRVNQNIGGSGRKQITVNCGGSASGQVLPPYVVYQGKNLYLAWTEGGPDGTTFTTSAKGWMEGPQFLDWFQKVFLKNTEHLSSNPRVLIFDGHASHLSLALMEAAKKNKIILLRLPAHLTHLLQPFDRAVFRLVKAVWQSLLVKYARTHTGPVSKAHFPAMLKKLYEKSFASDIVKAGFRATGIFPFNKNAVPLEGMANRHGPMLATSQANLQMEITQLFLSQLSILLMQ
ncbi:uncharacterized protein LOC121389691 [Gigantopelta aegis]|uniref:uncharacterized protein LOC121389691 n=1 Tax=Gigantopelta aegis TaxID=1735272 RepID=UPI001B88ABEF|nr:uncharacterized protein LOC121389691 [Gigantopelta aegis]